MDREREPQYYADIIAGTLERTIRRLWVLCILLAVLLAASWAGFLWWESQWDDVAVTQDVETGNGAAFITGVGDVHYGEGKANG